MVGAKADGVGGMSGSQWNGQNGGNHSAEFDNNIYPNDSWRNNHRKWILSIKDGNTIFDEIKCQKMI